MRAAFPRRRFAGRRYRLRMLNPQSPLGRLLDAPMRPGILRWIGLRPARRAAMLSVPDALLDPEHGLLGDHHGGRAGGVRQVTLLQHEHLPVIGAFLGRPEPVMPEALRRNLVVAGINLLALSNRRLRIGDAVLEATGPCHPCTRMEQAFGPGGYNAVRGHGGLTARVQRVG